MTSDELTKALVHELAQVETGTAQAKIVIEEAKVLYGPLAGPLALPPASGRKRWWISRVLRWLAAAKFDRFITFPFWFLWTVAWHVALGGLLLGALGCATYILVLLGRAGDRSLGIELPLLSGCAVCFGVLGGLGTAVSIVSSCIDRLKRCPW